MSLPPFHNMTLSDLAAWVIAHNNDTFDTGEFPAIDDLDDGEAAAVREEYEAMADQIVEANTDRDTEPGATLEHFG